MLLLNQNLSPNSNNSRRFCNRVRTSFKQQPPSSFGEQHSTWHVARWEGTATATSYACKRWTARWPSSRARASSTRASCPTASCPALSPTRAHSTLCSPSVPRAASRSTGTSRWRRPPTTIPTRRLNRALPSPLYPHFPVSELWWTSATRRPSRNSP